MFDIVFGFMESLNLAGMLLMGGVFLLLGGGMIGYELYWRMNAQAIKGRISAVRMVSARNCINEQREKYDDEGEGAKEEAAGKKGKIAVTIFVSLFLALPLIFSVIGVYTIYKYYSLTSSGAYAEATVVRNERFYDSESGTSYFAILEFRDQRGKLWEVRDSFGSSSISFQTGTQVGVYYDESDPERFVIDDYWHSVGIGMIFAGFGFLFLAVAGMIAFFAKRKSMEVKSGGKTNTSGEMYYPVYEYQDINGNRMERVGLIGRNSLLGIMPGKEVRLLMFPDKPEKVRKPMTFLLIFGLVFLLPGLFILYQAVSSFEGTPASLVIMFLIIGVVGWRIRIAIDKAPSGAINEAWTAFQEQRKSGKGFNFGISSGKQNNKMVELGQSEIDVRAKKQAGQAIITGYIALLIVAGLSVGSYYAGLDMLEMTLNGQRAQGEVVDINSRYSSNSNSSGYTYYAVVAFKDAAGNKARFEDSVGSSHSLYKGGDRVTVLYNPENSGDVIIDRGIMNWGLSGGLALGALVLLLLGISALKQGRENSGMRYRTRI